MSLASSLEWLGQSSAQQAAPQAAQTKSGPPNPKPVLSSPLQGIMHPTRTYRSVGAAPHAHAYNLRAHMVVSSLPLSPPFCIRSHAEQEGHPELGGRLYCDYKMASTCVQWVHPWLPLLAKSLGHIVHFSPAPIKAELRGSSNVDSLPATFSHFPSRTLRCTTD